MGKITFSPTDYGYYVIPSIFKITFILLIRFLLVVKSIRSYDYAQLNTLQQYNFSKVLFNIPY